MSVSAFHRSPWSRSRSQSQSFWTVVSFTSWIHKFTRLICTSHNARCDYSSIFLASHCNTIVSLNLLKQCWAQETATNWSFNCFTAFSLKIVFHENGHGAAIFTRIATDDMIPVLRTILFEKSWDRLLKSNADLLTSVWFGRNIVSKAP